MGILGWIIFGLIIGVLAKLVMPGKQGYGWLATIILGILGAMLGGWIGSALGMGSVDSPWSLGSIIMSVIGAVILIAIYGALTRKRP
ncbi:MAG: GlsB/YeaQ/YmgE family stress response membrane protein [Chryseobacterium sp.]|nr:MAG: GlsB/YeaQ/YmgE family stress response membrane protein [Chryseobacterium sp.]